MWPLLLGLAALLAFGRRGPTGPTAPTGAPEAADAPQAPQTTWDPTTNARTPAGVAPQSTAPAPGALVPSFPGAPAPTPVEPTEPIAPPANQLEAKLMTAPSPVVKQPPGATGNLPNITRPMGTSNFNPPLAAQLAKALRAELRKPPQKVRRAVVLAFQKAADLQPVDGVYGPRTAGALRYYLADASGKADVPPPFTRDKRIIPYGI